VKYGLNHVTYLIEQVVTWVTSSDSPNYSFNHSLQLCWWETILW
jgi:hypothetical protein